jgi:hypothetical protein
MRWSHPLDFINADSIVAVYGRLSAGLPDILRQVEHKRIVIIDYQNHHA